MQTFLERAVMAWTEEDLQDVARLASTVLALTLRGLTISGPPAIRDVSAVNTTYNYDIYVSAYTECRIWHKVIPSKNCFPACQVVTVNSYEYVIYSRYNVAYLLYLESFGLEEVFVYCTESYGCLLVLAGNLYYYIL